VPEKGGASTRAGLIFKRGFHERLKAARVATGMDEEAIAIRLQVSRQKYISYETQSLPPHHLIPELCEILRVTIDELFGIGVATRGTS
jgi:transcriptional regulator with XRE-family HTH domain